MQFLKLFVLTVQLKMFHGGSPACTDIKPCSCSVTNSLQVIVNCRKSGLNVSNICEICSKVKQVRSLDIGENGLTNIPPSCFENCTDLKELYIDSNILSNVTKDAFNGLTNLKLLVLNNNSLVTNSRIHDPELFQPLKGLKELRIQRNINIQTETGSTTYLSNIGNDTLRGLESLYLDGMPYNYFGENFRGFRNLTNITFSGSLIFNLTSDTFRNVPRIKTLDLSFCNLTNIEADTFEPLKEISLLNLSYNMALGFPTLRNVSYGLRDSQSIEILDYSKVYKTFGLTTQLNRCDLWYLQNTSLKEIHLNSNRMASIEINALHLMPVGLEVVHLEDNKLTFGPYTLQIGCVTNLKRLELNRQDFAHPMVYFNDEMEIIENKIDTSGGCPVKRKSLKRDCRLGKHKRLNPFNFRFPLTLKTISYRRSNLRYEPSVYNVPFRLRNSIEFFDLSGNIIYKWHDPLVVFSALKHLNLSNNFCSNITGDFFKNCPNLETFDASYNKIGPVLESDIRGSIFERVINLRILIVSGNWIEKLPANIFIHLRWLEHLDLSFNQLETVNFRFEHMKNLSTLILRQNKISALSIKLMEHMRNNAENNGNNVSIDLSDNMLDAEDCNNLDFLDWLVEYENDFYNIKNYTFFKAGHVKISFDEMKNTLVQFRKGCQRYIYTGITVVASTFIVVMIAIIISGVFYRYRWRLRYFYYMTKARYDGYVPVKHSEFCKIYRYDVFISYSTENYQFVTGEMYNQLNEMGLSMCLHQKDFLPGNDIAGNIVQAVRNSKMTLVVLSPAFLESKWCIYEFNMARMESIYSRGGENMIFVVMYEPVDLTKISLEMRDCLESESYLTYPNNEEERSYFWQMLKEALKMRDNAPTCN